MKPISIILKGKYRTAISSRNRQLILLFFLSAFYFFALIGCDINRLISKPSPSDPQVDFLLFLLAGREDSNYDLFYYEPNPTPDVDDLRSDVLKFRFPQTIDIEKKNVLIFIHGWNFKERNSDPPSDFGYKVSQIKDTWAQAIKFYESSSNNWKNRTNMYFFTYRTSNRIFDNGRRLQTVISQNFQPSDNIIIIAHSMGGLVARQAMLNENDQTYIDGVISLGTPYYGSPFAVPGFQSDVPILPDVISFYTNTDGGKDLAHTNSFSGQPSISNGNNVYLDLLSAKNSSLDTKTITYYGNLVSCQSADLVIYRSGCSLLKSKDSGFAINDGIVPVNSASLGGNGREKIEVINTDHSMISFLTITESIGRDFFESVMQKAENSFFISK
ncbi:lipase family alpha/beta hydrolase [Leptospira sp. GIMC2001]|uniref:lipase family alpha/beta hydrolase n=1 Tax=Leptospira sp. GIMC2001 TaxID=1513297 RepID=UPI00234BB6BC|nr:hypothetical protein [Leptospira sp. GIMC2001]WCL48012.1 hypothetical protein O4O04_11855 [Leptospira sp. GIMC2001]